MRSRDKNDAAHQRQRPRIHPRQDRAPLGAEQLRQVRGATGEFPWQLSYEFPWQPSGK